MAWAITLAGFGMGILVTGGEKALKTVQTSTIVGGVILIPVIVILTVGLFKSLRNDFKDTLAVKEIIRPDLLEEQAEMEK